MRCQLARNPDNAGECIKKAEWLRWRLLRLFHSNSGAAIAVWKSASRSRRANGSS